MKSNCTTSKKLHVLLIFFFLLLNVSMVRVYAQRSTSSSISIDNKGQEKDKKKKSKRKKKIKLPPEDITGMRLMNAQINFSSSGLRNTLLNNPTSIQFGPDGRLYVSQQDGLIKILTVIKEGPNSYVSGSTEIVNLINQIPNHNDDGSLASLNTRQVTGMVVTGTATNPVIYISSSDIRQGGPGGDLNLDTNSGMISRLTKNGNSWSKIDLVRGLPRSEENHSPCGMQLDTQTNILYITQGGNTNGGSPSNNFAFLSEYALSNAILSINLTTIDAMPTKGTGNTAYKYDLPTLDDPTRPNNPDGTDVNDPFGGNDGLNQAKLVPGGPVQVYATGLRHAYDLLITKTYGRAGRMYTVDNGGNQGWGGHPANEGPQGNVTNNYVPGELGSSGPGPNDAIINNLDALHYIGNTSTYTPGTFYGGHPNPIRANPNGAGLYTHEGTNSSGVGVWRTSKSGPNPLPADWPPVPANMAHPIEGDFQNAGETDNALLTFEQSTNGLAEYTASNFNGAMKGDLLAAGFNGDIFRIVLDDEGNVLNTSKEKRINTDLPFASNFGSQPLDIIAQGDNDVFPGTIWAATYGSNTITIFEPQEVAEEPCEGTYDNRDEDGDGYTNADEIDNASNPCSGSSRPADFDKDLVSDLNDTDDDNDGIADISDKFAIDAANGNTTTLSLLYNLFNNDPGTGFFGLGFNGLMSNGIDDYLNLFDENSLVAGGAVGAFTILNVTPGDAYQNLNDQDNAFQFGINTNSATKPFTVHARMLAPFFNNLTPQGEQSQGMFIGTGDQDNYVKIVLNANNGAGGIQIISENAGVATIQQFSIDAIPSQSIDLLLSINPATGMVQAKYAINGSVFINLGQPFSISGSVLSAIQGPASTAVGIIATSRGTNTPFSATWDFINVTLDSAPADYLVNAGGDAVTISGKEWSTDQFFNGGATYTNPNITDIKNTTSDILYKSERYGSTNQFSYDFPIPQAGTYTVKLHFAEIYHGATGGGPGGIGKRVFSVNLEGGAVELANFDIFKEVGAMAAVVKTFNVSVDDGVLNIQFIKITDGPKVSAIEILPFTGNVAPALVLSTESLHFFTQQANTTSDPQEIILTNTGSSPLNITSLAFSGTNANQFNHNLILPISIAAGVSIPLNVTFTPTSLGTKVAQLTITHNGTNSPSSIALTGEGADNPPVTQYAINAGGGAVTLSGKAWAADGFFSGGNTYTNNNIADIKNTTSDAIYKSERYGAANYNFPLTNGNYIVKLHFAEIYLGATGGGAGGVGKRVFSVNLEGGAVELANFDIFAEAGSMAAVIKTFNVSVEDGALNIDFIKNIDEPKISAIEITPFIGNTSPSLSVSTGSISFASQQINTTSAPEVVTLTNTGLSTLNITSLAFSGTNASQFSHNLILPVSIEAGISVDVNVNFTPTSSGTKVAQLVITHSGTNSPTSIALTGEGTNTTPVTQYAINAGGGAVTLSGKAWAADGFFSGGNTYTNNNIADIKNTTSDAIYKSERYGIMDYNFPLPQAGTYIVKLHFAEIYLGATGGGAGGIGKRVFSVNLEGGAVELANFDIFAEAGSMAAVIKTFNVSVEDGSLDINFIAGVDLPKVSAIEITPFIGNTSPSLSVSTGSISFASQQINTTSAPEVVTLTNTGLSTLNITSLAFSGTNASQFSHNLILPVSIEAGISVDVNVNFTPTSSGTKVAQLVITHSGTNSPTSIALTGEGTNTTPVTQYAINAGGGAVTLSGKAWAADGFFSGGNTYTNNNIADIKNTTSDALYLTERYGAMNYTFPITQAGTYIIKLHFAEIYHGATGGDAGGIGKRVFSVNLEGGAVELANFDIFAEAGSMAAVIKTFNVSVEDGALNIDFIKNIDEPKISAIEITPVGSEGARIASSAETISETLYSFTASPNPFSSKIKFEFSSPIDDQAILHIYNAQGILINTLYAGLVEKNKKYAFDLSGENMHAGAYIARLSVGGKNVVKKVFLLK